MYAITNKLWKVHFLIWIGTFIVIFSLFLGSGKAKAGWWEKGAEMFKTLGNDDGKDELTVGEIGSAFKDALRIGTENVVSQLGRVDGFNADPAIHIKRCSLLSPLFVQPLL